MNPTPTISDLLTIYREKFKEIPIMPQDTLVKLKHALEMIDKMEAFHTEGQIEKFNRWLGFVQGVFWMTGVYTLDEMKTHNRTFVHSSSSLSGGAEGQTFPATLREPPTHALPHPSTAFHHRQIFAHSIPSVSLPTNVKELERSQSKLEE